VIDVLASLRKPVANQQIYEADYSALKDLTTLANELEIAILVVHHVRKMKSADPFETINGSYGLNGAVDTLLVMTSDGTLHVRGRDVESREFAIEFDKDSCRWKMLGDANLVRVSEQQSELIKVLKPEEPMSIEMITALSSLKKNTVTVQLNRLYHEGRVQRVERGVYCLAKAN
jgi:hypothetical protein